MVGAAGRRPFIALAREELADQVVHMDRARSRNADCATLRVKSTIHNASTRWQGGDPANVCNEHTELKWFSISEMPLLTNIVDSDYPPCLPYSLALPGEAS
jgi:hypothetical protein